MTTNQIIAKEGYTLLLALLFFLLFLYVAKFSSIFLITTLLFIGALYIFRNPERIPEDDGDDIYLAPIDGRVIKIETDGNRIQIVVKNSLFDTHLLRAPNSYTITKSHLVNGAALCGDSKMLSELNEQAEILFERENRALSMKIISTLFARYLQLYRGINENVKKGERVGFCLSGLVLLEIPQNSRLKINVGDKIYSGQSVVGYFTK